MRGIAYTYERYFSLSAREFRGLLATTLVAAFFLAFRYGGTNFDRYFDDPITSVVLVFIFFFIMLIITVVVQKAFAIACGYTATYRFFGAGFAIGLIVFILSATTIPLFFPGYLAYDLIKHRRMGRYRPLERTWEMALIGLSGPITNMLLIIVLGPLRLAAGPAAAPFWEELIIYNLGLMLFALLPVPLIHLLQVGVFPHYGSELHRVEEGTVGFSLFYYSRTWWLFAFVLAIIYGVLVLAFEIPSFLLALLLALFVCYLYYRFYESR